MEKKVYKSYDELPLFLNAAMVATVLGVSPSSGYELMHAVVTNSTSLLLLSPQSLTTLRGPLSFPSAESW